MRKKRKYILRRIIVLFGICILLMASILIPTEKISSQIISNNIEVTDNQMSTQIIYNNLNVDSEEEVIDENVKGPEVVLGQDISEEAVEENIVQNTIEQNKVEINNKEINNTSKPKMIMVSLIGTIAMIIIFIGIGVSKNILKK